MFVDHKLQFNKYCEIDRRLVPIMDFIENTKPEDLKVGRYDLTEDIFYIVSNNKKTGTTRFESHKKYIDVQYIVSGAECMLCAPVYALKECEAYNPEKDVVFYPLSEKENTSIDLYSGDFVVFYPHDAHSPEHPINDNEVLKIVFKIPV